MKLEKPFLVKLNGVKPQHFWYRCNYPCNYPRGLSRVNIEAWLNEACQSDIIGTEIWKFFIFFPLYIYFVSEEDSILFVMRWGQHDI